MMSWILDLLSFGLIAIMVMPLFLVGFLALSAWLDWPIGSRILDLLFVALMSLWVVGGVLNILFGIALMGLSIWVAQHGDSGWRWPGAGLILTLGAWRVWRGAIVLRDYRNTSS